jgi:hypothetical protein
MPRTFNHYHTFTPFELGVFPPGVATGILSAFLKYLKNNPPENGFNCEKGIWKDEGYVIIVMDNTYKILMTTDIALTDKWRVCFSSAEYEDAMQKPMQEFRELLKNYFLN